MKTVRRFTLAAAVSVLATGGLAVAAYAGKPDREAAHTRAEAQAMAGQMFDRMDANKDGKLDAADREARQAAMFDAIDTDGNGQLSRAEFAAHHAARGEGRMEGHRGHRGMRSHHGMHGDHGMRGHGMAGMADADGDKAVTRDEFSAAAMKRFDAADANRDGTVTQDERRAARKAMRESRREAWRERAGTATPSAPAS